MKEGRHAGRQGISHQPLSQSVSQAGGQGVRQALRAVRGRREALETLYLYNLLRPLMRDAAAASQPLTRCLKKPRAPLRLPSAPSSVAQWVARSAHNQEVTDSLPGLSGDGWAVNGYRVL